jgi:hypothetical protein
MRSKSNRRRAERTNGALGVLPRQTTQPSWLPKQDDAAVSAYEREIDRLDAAVQDRI